jgi:hypothetical protein
MLADMIQGYSAGLISLYKGHEEFVDPAYASGQRWACAERYCVPGYAMCQVSGLRACELVGYRPALPPLVRKVAIGS